LTAQTHLEVVSEIERAKREQNDESLKKLKSLERETAEERNKARIALEEHETFHLNWIQVSRRSVVGLLAEFRRVGIQCSTRSLVNNRMEEYSCVNAEKLFGFIYIDLFKNAIAGRFATLLYNAIMTLLEVSNSLQEALKTAASEESKLEKANWVLRLLKNQRKNPGTRWTVWLQNFTNWL
jgi:hypothetical protein